MEYIYIYEDFYEAFPFVYVFECEIHVCEVGLGIELTVTEPNIATTGGGLLFGSYRV